MSSASPVLRRHQTLTARSSQRVELEGECRIHHKARLKAERWGQARSGVYCCAATSSQARNALMELPLLDVRSSPASPGKDSRRRSHLAGSGNLWKSSYDFSSIIFNEQFSDGTVSPPSRWDNTQAGLCQLRLGCSPMTPTASATVSDVLWRTGRPPLKASQNRFDKRPTTLRRPGLCHKSCSPSSRLLGDPEARFPPVGRGLFAKHLALGRRRR